MKRAVVIVGGAVGAAVGLGSISVTWWNKRRRRPRWSPGRGARFDVGLHVRTLGDGPPIVLLHGLLGSGAYWGAAYDTLSTRGRLIVADLLGFGGSPHPDSGYTIDDHACAVLDTLDQLGADRPATIVAHSLGSLVALRVAQLAPSRVTAIVAFGPALYPDRESARRRVVGLGAMTRLLAFDTPLARRVCAWMCAHRRLAGALAVLARPDLPRRIAGDTTKHTWPSYSQTVTHVLLDGHGPSRIEGIEIPVVLIGGDHDSVIDRAHLAALGESHANVTFSVWPGEHDLPLQQPDRCLALIGDVLSSVSRSSKRP